MTPEEALASFIAEQAQLIHMGTQSYIVGGAVRDHVLGLPIKDLDVVVETRNGKNALTLGEAVAGRLGLAVHADQYGVVHIGPIQESFVYRGVDLKGQKIEIVTARQEKYDKSKKDSHKPSEVQPGTIRQDLERRDYSVNTLMWCLYDVNVVTQLDQSPFEAPITDLLGGLEDLKERVLRTPMHPEETFDEDPSRILRGIRFLVKYQLSPNPRTWEAFKSKAEEIRRLPYEVVAMVFIDKILALPKEQVQLALDMMAHLGLLRIVFDMVPSGRMRRGINQTIQDTRTLLKLMQLTSPQMVGHQLSDQEYRLLWEHSLTRNDQELDALYQKFLKPPFDTLRFIQDTGASGPAIGEAVSRARLKVLKNPSITAEELQIQALYEVP